MWSAIWACPFVLLCGEEFLTKVSRGLSGSGVLVVADLRRQFERGLLDESIQQIGSEDGGGPGQREHGEFAMEAGFEVIT